MQPGEAHWRRYREFNASGIQLAPCEQGLGHKKVQEDEYLLQNKHSSLAYPNEKIMCERLLRNQIRPIQGKERHGRAANFRRIHDLQRDWQAMLLGYCLQVARQACSTSIQSIHSRTTAKSRMTVGPTHEERSNPPSNMLFVARHRHRPCLMSSGTYHHCRRQSFRKDHTEKYHVHSRLDHPMERRQDHVQLEKEAFLRISDRIVDITRRNHTCRDLALNL